MNRGVVAVICSVAGVVGAVSSPGVPRAEIRYDGGVVLDVETDAGLYFGLKINGRTQVRFEYTQKRDAADLYAFSIPRARLKFTGNLFTDRLRYFFQLDFGKGTASMRDAGFDYVLAKRWLVVRGGQFKKPYGRQQLSSSGKLAFVDRALTNKTFDVGRDIGVMLHNDFSHSPAFEYGVGVFNGTGYGSHLVGSTSPTDGEIIDGDFTNIPDQMKPELVARVGYNYNGIQGYDEMPFADKDRHGFRLAVAASARYEFGADGADAVFGVQGDFIGRLGDWGFGGAYFLSGISRSADGDRALEGLDGQSVQLQTEYIIRDLVQPALRVVHVWYRKSDRLRTEYEAALNFYLMGPKFKWSNDVTASDISEAGREIVDFRFRTQVQVAF